MALVYRAIGLGDFLTGIPALRAIRRALPGHRLVLATSPPLAGLVPLVGGVDEVLPTQALRPLPWSGAPPAVAVNLHGRGPESHRVLAALRPDRLVAFGNADAGAAGPRWRADEHEVRRWCRLVEAELGVPAPDDDLALARPAAEPVVDGALVVHPGAGSGARRWPADRFAAVARRLADTGRGPVVVTGSAAETPLASAVAAHAGLPPSAVLAGRLSLTELAALVAWAGLVVANDTGVAHLASAYGVRSVVLFGPTPPAAWGPPEHGPHVALWHGPGSGDPHGRLLDPALESIQVREVLDAADTLLP
ncbi:glycosyltransferase family 9 protein [Jiangella aurantiaca]|uniref:Glycosyltransferase family 9 protein n=1 Tax=Jiangella aurantiaca TaxID=2530373 RepID=A0A4R5A6X0_9ACTN|nr:glycosyltransferase family 9 protein [Jiangella aurantiaca]TDD67375.1 glycosyltransferase family 9 protein [Jiangella aurantiaca]